jgi:hypothetical protein
MLISPDEAIAECVEKIDEKYFSFRRTELSTASWSTFGMPGKQSI